MLPFLRRIRPLAKNLFPEDVQCRPMSLAASGTPLTDADRRTPFSGSARCIHSSRSLLKFYRRDEILSAPKKAEGIEKDRFVNLDDRLVTRWDMFPDLNTPNLLFDGVRFAELPICHIKVTRNNTIIMVTDHQGKHIMLWSCGYEGFKNAKKGTNIAAQAAATTVAKKCLAEGIQTIRLKIGGLGPGRLPSVKGLQMAGMNIVSITDNTPMTWGIPPRGKKQRRL